MRELNDNNPDGGSGDPAGGSAVEAMSPGELAGMIAWSYHYGVPGAATGFGVCGAGAAWVHIGWLRGLLAVLAVLFGLCALVHAWLLAVAAREYADVLALTHARHDRDHPAEPHEDGGGGGGAGGGFDPRKEPWWG
ncbi:hypothetical protein [Amycolatopsis sp. CA-128772]|uniref:hypothetical protein n=1 Tax=Amycolatopsis sp. CA-128772 TaxID=2073159 RepID=UPI000CD15B38|nr:hypothetical protein [Amycolatopsis sp. CA-128772]